MVVSTALERLQSLGIEEMQPVLRTPRAALKEIAARAGLMMPPWATCAVVVMDGWRKDED
jgi:hypothetical protein